MALLTVWEMRGAHAHECDEDWRLTVHAGCPGHAAQESTYTPWTDIVYVRKPKQTVHYVGNKLIKKKYTNVSSCQSEHIYTNPVASWHNVNACV